MYLYIIRTIYIRSVVRCVYVDVLVDVYYTYMVYAFFSIKVRVSLLIIEEGCTNTVCIAMHFADNYFLLKKNLFFRFKTNVVHYFILMP